MIYFSDYCIRNSIWFILDRSDLIWSKNKWSWKSDDILQWLFHQKSNLIKFDPFWTDLIQSDKKNENLMIYFNDYFIRNWKSGKSGKFDESIWESQKSILRAFARTRAKKYKKGIFSDVQWWKNFSTHFSDSTHQECMVFARIGHGSCYYHWNEIFAGVTYHRYLYIP